MFAERPSSAEGCGEEDSRMKSKRQLHTLLASARGSAAVSQPYKLSEYIKENRRLRDWIREEGMRTDTCTYNILGEICEGCRCKRQPQQNGADEPQPPNNQNAKK
jgi:hypothetical protein